MMRQIFLVPVDADEVLKSAGDSCLLVHLQLGDIDHNIGFHDVARDEVLVTT